MPTTNPTPDPIRLPDIVSEQEEADILRDGESILEKARAYIERVTAKGDEVEKSFAEIVAAEVNAALMASEIRDYLEVITGNLDQNGAAKSADYVRRLAGYARQLEAHALYETEYLTA